MTTNPVVTYDVAHAHRMDHGTAEALANLLQEQAPHGWRWTVDAVALSGLRFVVKAVDANGALQCFVESVD